MPRKGGPSHEEEPPNFSYECGNLRQFGGSRPLIAGMRVAVRAAAILVGRPADYRKSGSG